MSLARRFFRSFASPRSPALFNPCSLLAKNQPRLDTALASAANVQRNLLVRGFSSLLAGWGNLRVSGLQSLGDFGIPGLLEAHRISQQVRHVYIEVDNDDFDLALKKYKRKMRDSKVEEKLKEKQYYTKPSERRKLAKHYKKLNRARRELGAKIRIVKHRMEKIREVRKINKEAKRAKGSEGA